MKKIGILVWGLSIGMLFGALFQSVGSQSPAYVWHNSDAWFGVFIFSVLMCYGFILNELFKS